MTLTEYNYKNDVDELESAKTWSSSDNLSVTINYKNCSVYKTAGLLFSEYICLAIMSFPWSYSILGLVPGLIITVGVSLMVLYTGLTITDYCIRYPHLQNVCDIGEHLFKFRWAWYATAVCFILNNTLIQALHVLTFAKYLNTVSNNTTICTVGFSAVGAVVCFIISLPRTFNLMSFIAVFSAGTMFVAVILSMVFVAIQGNPNGFVSLVPVTYNLWPEKGTSYVNGMAAVLNIVYTFVGQITYPSFISQMKKPKDFKKALYIVTASELVVFALAGSIIYVYVGGYYMTAPAFGSLKGHYKTIAFSFALPTIIFLGALYGNVSSQFIFLKIFDEKSSHRNTHTIKGWSIWVALNLATWIFAFILAEVIPFFLDLLSMMSSLFDCWFGFIFWGVAYFKLKHQKLVDEGKESSLGAIYRLATLGSKIEMALNVILIFIGIYILGPGLYATIQSIITSYHESLYGPAFSCVSNAI